MDYFLADDLSGALDAAAAFHDAGRRVRIVLHAADWKSEPNDDVVAITTETRNAAPDVAARVVREVLQHAKARGARLRYKKIDSTLRGPVAAELGALTDALPDTRVLFCPANPRVGRTVHDGVLLVRGVPVAETDFGRDPICPVRESSISRLLGPLAARVTVLDASTEAELAKAVELYAATGTPWLAVGSGALARPVARLGLGKKLTGGGRGSRPAVARYLHEPLFRDGLAGAGPSTDPVLFVGGSAHAANRAQAATLAREHDVASIVVDPAAPARAGEAAANRLLAGESVALLLPEARIDCGVALRAIVQAGSDAIAQTKIARVFATGGETAFALCGALGVRSLQFEKEIEPGLALARGDKLLLAVKPGGFGDVRTWVRAWTELGAAR